jgi:hypothetical protein
MYITILLYLKVIVLCISINFIKYIILEDKNKIIFSIIYFFTLKLLFRTILSQHYLVFQLVIRKLLTKLN